MRRFVSLLCGFLCALLLCLHSLPCFGDDVVLKNGFTLSGTAVQVPGLNVAMANRNTLGNVRVDGFVMVDDGVRRFFVGKRIVEEVRPEDLLSQRVTFELKHQRSSRKAGPSIVGGFTGMEPFDRFGRRTVMLSTKDGPTPIIQGITKLGPDHFEVDSLTHQWEYKLDTKTLPPELILQLMEQAADRNNPAERKAAVIFFLQARMLAQAEQELERISVEFSELRDWAEEFRVKIREEKARAGIEEVQMRRQAGQHQLAYLIAKSAPEDELSAPVYRESREIVAEYEKMLGERDEAYLLLDLLQAELPLETADRLRSLKATLIEEMSFETIGRLRPFLRTKQDDTLGADQKLALAYSAWVVGEAQATLNLDEAVTLWQARFQILEFLRNTENPLLDRELIKELMNLEYIGLPRLVQMIPLLPPFQFGEIPPVGDVIERSVPHTLDEPVTAYSLMLPPEYSPQREYPLLVVLRTAGHRAEEDLRWWAGDARQPGWAQRRGYIVIAPHYTEENAQSYGGNTAAHQIVTKSIRDVLQRYRVDADRVFLVGHGMGADAAFDIGMSRPDWFAGVVAIGGETSQICNYYWSNGPDVGWYIVGGERDRNILDNSAHALNNMMRHGQSVIYCDYKARGFESYFEEQERIFKWMQLQRRPPLSQLKEWEVSTIRKSENSFYWLDSRGFRSEHFPEDVFSVKKSKPIYVKATPGNTVYVQTPGTSATLWLTPELVDFDERVRIRFNTRYLPRDFVKPSMETLLTRLRETGDRQRLYWAKVEM